jgi:hypothetical protein
MDKQRMSHLGTLYLEAKENQLTPAQLLEVKDWIDDEFSRIPYRVEFVEYQPYKSAEEMTLRVASDKVLLISNSGSESELLGTHHNLKFRAVHDWHHLKSGADFSILGEWQAYLHAITRTQSRIVKAVLFSEIVLQAAAYHVLGDFPETQKLVLLFDNDNNTTTRSKAHHG